MMRNTSRLAMDRTKVETYDRIFPSTPPFWGLGMYKAQAPRRLNGERCPMH